jgi:serine/threonine protein kinase
MFQEGSVGYKKGETLKTAFDTYTIQKVIGAGGSGEVYEVRDPENAAYAAKILNPARASAIRLKRFKNEIYFCTKNTHRNIIQVRESGVTEKGATFYVMPLFSGTLRDLISKGIAPSAVLPYFSRSWMAWKLPTSLVCGIGTSNPRTYCSHQRPILWLWRISG